jgi:hypothetical protein
MRKYETSSGKATPTKARKPGTERDLEWLCLPTLKSYVSEKYAFASTQTARFGRIPLWRIQEEEAEVLLGQCEESGIELVIK